MTDEQLDKAIAEHDRQIAEVWAVFKKTRELFTIVGEQMAETDRKIAQTNQELGKKIDQAVGGLANKWGRFIEYFLAPGLPQAFQKRGIIINQVHQRVKAIRNGTKMEIDLMGVNEESVVLVEVKSTLGVEDVREHLERIGKFKMFFPVYASKEVLGGVAGIEVTSEADKFAERQGLFVLGQKGDTVKILNDEKFKPKVW